MDRGKESGSLNSFKMDAKEMDAKIKKIIHIIPHHSILFDLVDAVEGINMDAAASAIYNILESLLPGEYSTEYLDETLQMLIDELQNHVGG